MNGLFRRIKNDAYQYQLTHLVDDARLSMLENECLKAGATERFDDWTFVNREMEPNKLYYFFNKDEEAGTPMLMDTYYFFYNNTCVVYSHKGLDKVIRVRVKNPNDVWNESTEYAEIYDWWDVDWMGVNRRDCNFCVKSGAWCSTVYKDINKIYEALSGRDMENKMNSIYRQYEKENRK